jgi:hypothetical protein
MSAPADDDVVVHGDAERGGKRASLRRLWLKQRESITLVVTRRHGRFKSGAVGFPVPLSSPTQKSS